MVAIDKISVFFCFFFIGGFFNWGKTGHLRQPNDLILRLLLSLLDKVSDSAESAVSKD